MLGTKLFITLSPFLKGFLECKIYVSNETHILMDAGGSIISVDDSLEDSIASLHEELVNPSGLRMLKSSVYEKYNIIELKKVLSKTKEHLQDSNPELFL